MVSPINNHTDFEETATLAKLRDAFERVSTEQTPYEEFGSLLKSIDWEAQSAEFFEQTIEMVLLLSRITLAYKLAVQGTALYPENAKIATTARVLAPGKFLGTSPAIDHSASMRWYQEHGADYRGLWVAVEDGILIGTAPTRQALTEVIGSANNLKIVIAHIPS